MDDREQQVCTLALEHKGRNVRWRVGVLLINYNRISVQKNERGRKKDGRPNRQTLDRCCEVSSQHMNWSELQGVPKTGPQTHDHNYVNS